MSDPNEIAELIRARSGAGKITALADIEAALSAPVAEGEAATAQAVLQNLVVSHPDISLVRSASGDSFYFSDRFMTCSYANLLALREAGFLQMMAEVIREHSRIYPRPVPLSLFESSPFNLSGEQAGAGLKEMKESKLYSDIAQITTSVGNIFAYSTSHLDHRYAAMLAEWIDVGQAENP